MSKIAHVLGMNVRPFQIRGDSKSAIVAVGKSESSKNTKHMEIHLQFMKDRLRMNELDFEHIPGSNNPADMFTKSLGRQKFFQFRTMIGMVNLADYQMAIGSAQLARVEVCYL